MILMKKALLGMGIILLIIIGSGCLTTPQEPEPVPEQTPTPPSAVPDFDYSSVSDETCGECHINAFTSISLKGGRHDKGCTFCHIQHGITPGCTDCHDLVHGTQFQDCKDCHDEHAPMNITSSMDFKQSCSNCHSQQFQEFSDHPGKHDNLECSYCHQTHKQIEACTNCHAPHGTWLPYTECLNCHPAHFPQEINYPEGIADETCAACHKVVSDALEQGNTKHTALGCSECHSVHEQIPECMDCHTPHTPDMTNEDCTGCHLAHDPLKMEFPADTGQDICEMCHEKINSVLSASNTKHEDLGCIYCHPKHRYLPTCESCHELPHQKFVHEDYPVCVQCHIVSHDVKKIVFTK